VAVLAAVRITAAGCLLLLVSALWVGSMACHRERDPAEEAARLDDGPTTVRDTFDRLRSWHAKGNYVAMRPYIAADGRVGLLDLLVAVDRLIAANNAALVAVAKACPTMDLRPFDLSIIQDNLDLFSRQIQWVSVDEQGDHAVVTAEVSGRLPLATMRFERQQGRWCYAPGAGDPTILTLIRQITRSLKQIELVVNTTSQPSGKLSEKPSGKLSEEQIAEEYRIRILPKIRKMASQPSG